MKISYGIQTPDIYPFSNNCIREAKYVTKLKGVKSFSPWVSSEIGAPGTLWYFESIEEAFDAIKKLKKKGINVIEKVFEVLYDDDSWNSYITGEYTEKKYET